MATIDTNMSLVMIDPNEPLELYDGTIIKGRLEWFLYALCCLDYGNLPTPLSRIEEWANALITNELPNMEPQSRAEEFFKAILTGDTSNLPTPQSRSEVLLDKLARGENDFTNVEKIQSRYEFLLAYLIKNGGGIGNIDYVLYKFQKEDETLYNTKERPVKSAILKGSTKYKDVETGEILDEFDAERNLELVSVKMPVLTTTGENLFNPEKMVVDKGSLYGYYKVKDNENIKCTLSLSDKDTSVELGYVFLGITKTGVNAEGGYDWLVANGGVARPSTMSLTSEFNFISIYPNNVDTLNTLTKRFNIQVEYGEVKTAYEPHKSNILTVNEEVELRGIGEGSSRVEDELDCLTGEMTERIGEIVLDGNQNFIAWGSYGFYISDSTLTTSSTVQCINNKYPSYTNASELSKATGNGIAVNNSRLYIKINEVTSVNEFVAYLKSNPITVQYQLATESVKTVDLTITDQDGATIPKLKTFDKITHVNVSTTDILPGVEMEVATTIGEDLSGTLYSTMEDIETKQEALKESNNTQTESVNSTMMATTEIYESLL